MFIEFELKGSKALHKGVFDTTGFWARFEPQQEEGFEPEGWKIYSHFSFSFYHEDFSKASMVYEALVNALNGFDWVTHEIGFIREVC